MGRRSILGCLVIFGGVLAYLLLHGEDSYTELVFSDKSGFYEEPFELELYAPRGTEIYYTLDGSEPDGNAIKYTGPILIDDASKNENVYAMRTDVSVAFLFEDTKTYGYPHYVVPDYRIDKCTVVKAAYLDADGNYSKVKTESYFIGFDDKAGYDGLNIISIITDPDNLFHRDTGIYVLGRVYDVMQEDMEQVSRLEMTDSNYRRCGLDWERIAQIQLFNTERKLLLNQECGIRIQGGITREVLPRSFNIYARKQYGGEGRFYFDIFGTGYMPDAVTLFAGGNDWNAKLKDMLMSRLVKDRDFATMNFEPYAMFLDGEYWGIYWLTEKYDDAYLGYYYGVDKDNIIMIKSGELAEGKEEDFALYKEMMDYMAYTDFSVRENYEYACELIDMQSYIDYYAAQIYIARYADWPVFNEALWRTNETEDGAYGDCKWRWLLFDVNSGALSKELADMDTLGNTIDNSAMFCNLCKNNDFKKQFVNTFMDIVNTSFTDENVDNIISAHVDLMAEPMGVHFRRFFGAEEDSQFYNVGNNRLFFDAVADVQAFFDNRRPYIVQYLKEDFGLTGNLVPVEIAINDAEAGSIMINTAKLTFEDNMAWTGEYYTDYPVTLTAIPNEGYRFVGWENHDSMQENESNQFSLEDRRIEVNLPECGFCVKAVFEKINE